MRNREKTKDMLFQPTLPVWGETTAMRLGMSARRLFQPTLPVWGETKSALGYRETPPISTHSPRVGRDGATLNLLSIK